MGPQEFLRQLCALGYSAIMQGQYLILPFSVPLGTLIGQDVRLGLFATMDFPLTPPPGPHVSPRLGHPAGAVHESELGAEWEYWSRPYPEWSQSGRSAREYMAHIRELFAQR